MRMNPRFQGSWQNQRQRKECGDVRETSLGLSKSFNGGRFQLIPGRRRGKQEELFCGREGCADFHGHPVTHHVFLFFVYCSSSGVLSSSDSSFLATNLFI